MPLVSNRYELLELLGRGATAEVYRSRDTQTDQRVALKWSLGEDSTSRIMFRQEYCAMRRLSHPGLVQAFELGRFEGRDFFTMELIDGASLPDLAHWEAPRLRHVLTELADILGYLHSQGLCHGDLKPENLRLDHLGRLRLLDLGFLMHAGRPGQGRGTLEYMAPEVLRREPVDPRSDLYAMGVMAYQWLAGQPPFCASDPLSLLNAQLHEAPRSLAELRADLAPASAQAITACLDKTPANRPPTAGHLLARMGWGEAGGYLVFGNEIFGRTPERMEIDRRIELQLQGQEPALSLLAPSGTGKTRLLLELETAGLPVLRVEGQGEAPYSLLRALLEISEVVLAKLQVPKESGEWSALRTLMPSWGEPLPPLEPKAQENRLAQALMSLLGKLAGDRGLVIVLDDWELGDAPSRELLEGILKRPNGRKLAWIVALEQAAIEGPEPLILPPWEAMEAEQFLRMALCEEPPEGLLELAMERTSGNPAQLRALLSHWHAEKALKREYDRWVFDVSKAESLPWDLAEASAARLARLSPEALGLAQGGAIIGQVFSLAQLAELMALDTLDGLAELVAAEFIERRDDSYRFFGSLRAQVLATLEARESQALHARAFQLYAGLQDLEGLTMAARHLLLSGSCDDPEPVLKAARTNLLQGSLRIVEELMNELLTHPLEGMNREEAVRLLADAMRTRGEVHEALRLYEEAIALARSLGAQEALCRELTSAGRTAMALSDLPRVQAWSQEALELSRSLGDSAQAARCQMTLGRSYLFQGNHHEAQKAVEAAVALADEANDEVQKALALGLLGVMAPPTDLLARTRLEQAIELNRRLQNPIGLIDGLINLGDRRMVAGDLRGAEAVFQEALTLCQQIGSANEETFVLLNLAQTKLEEGHPQEACQLAKRGLELAEALAQGFPAGFAQGLLSLIQLKLGAYGAARSALKAAKQKATETGNRYVELVTLLAQAAVWLELGEWEDAERSSDEAYLLAESMADPLSAAKALCARGSRLALTGAFDEAERALAAATQKADQAGGRLVLAQISCLRGHQELLRKRKDEAIPWLEAAIAAAGELGADELSAEARRLLGDALLALNRPDEALVSYRLALGFAQGASMPLLEALALLGVMKASQGPERSQARTMGDEIMRRLAKEAETEHFFRSPDRNFRLRPAGVEAESAFAGSAEMLGILTDLMESTSSQVLLDRLLRRALSLTEAMAGALLTYRTFELEAYSYENLPEASLTSLPLVEQVYWSQTPVYEAQRWVVPLLDGDDTMGVLFLSGELKARSLIEDLAEGLMRAIKTFRQWGTIQSSFERLAFSNSLAKHALSRPTDAMRHILDESMRVTGASRALVLQKTAQELALVVGRDCQGRSLGHDVAYSRSICQQVLETGESARLVDVQNLEQWQSQQSILALDLKTLLVVPLCWNDEVTGLLYLDSTSLVQRLGPQEQNLLEGAAEVLAPLLHQQDVFSLES